MASPAQHSGMTRVGQRLTSPTGILFAIPGLVLALGLIMALTGIYGTKQSLIEVAGIAFAEAADRAADDLRRTHDRASPLMDTWSRWLRDHSQNADRETMAQIMQALIGDNNAVAWISWSDSQGHFVGLHRRADGSLELVEHTPPSGATPGSRHAFIIEDSGALTLDEERVDSYDPRLRPHWKTAIEAGTDTWTRPYRFAEGAPGVTLSRPLFGPESTVLGVATVDFSLASLSTLVATMRDHTGSTLCIFTADGTLLAWPDPISMPSSERLPTIDDVNAPPLHGLLSAIRKQGDDDVVSFRVDGDTWLGHRRKYEQIPDQTWHVAAFAPASQFLASSRGILAMSGIAALIGLSLAVLTAWALARSINRHRQALARAQQAADSARKQVRELGSYELLRKLGEGGMGEVWLGRHRLLARPAAVKLIHREALAAQDGDVEVAIQRFEREARTTATLRSRNTVEIYDFGMADGTFFLVMELLEGTDVHDLVSKQGPPPIGRSIAILRQVCRSLAEAHANGLVHRDIKPGNIFLCRRADELDIVKVLDFGMVIDRSQDEQQRLTQAGYVSGTPGYMAPEQACGQHVDGRADIYALGCVAWFLLTGQMPFQHAAAMDLMLAHVNDPPPPLEPLCPRQLPTELKDLVMSCLAKEAEGRPQTAKELEASLTAIPIPPAETWDLSALQAWWACAECRSAGEDFSEAKAARNLMRSSVAAHNIDPEASDGPAAVSVQIEAKPQ